jgi:uncharacterized RDD family membrane protein YckC
MIMTENSQTAPQESTAPGTSGKADLGKRFIAGIIDAAIAAVVGFIPVIGGFIGAAYMLLRDGLNYEFMDHRSVGKKLMKLRPVALDGGKIDINTSVKRNWMFALGAVTQVLVIIPVFGWVLIPIVGLAALIIVVVEIVLVFNDGEGRRWGDKLANTKVIEVSE